MTLALSIAGALMFLVVVVVLLFVRRKIFYTRHDEARAWSWQN